MANPNNRTSNLGQQPWRRWLALDGQSSPERAYVLLCLASVVVLLFTLGSRLGAWSLLPVLPAIITVLLRWESGLALLFATVAVLFLAERIQPRDAMFVSWSWKDFGLCAALLAFTIGHLRLQTLRKPTVFLPEPPHQIRRGYSQHQGANAPHSPSPQVVRPGSGTDILTVLVIVLLSAGWAMAGGLWLLGESPRLGLRTEIWHAMLFIWIFALVLFVGRSIRSLFQLHGATPEEAALVLQDVLWRETCKEQRRIYSWLAWARQRRRKEKL